MPTEAELKRQLDDEKRKVVDLEGQLKAKRLDEDRDRCLSVAQLYQDSWNRLRDHEWRLEITLWTTFLTFVGVLACGGIKAFSIEISVPKAISGGMAQSWLVVGLVAVTILMTVGSIGMQMAFRYFERMRDYYVKRGNASPSDKHYNWDNPTKYGGVPWHTWNSTVSVASTLSVTAILALLTYSLLPSEDGAEKQKAIKAIVENVEKTTDGKEVRIRLKDNSDILVMSKASKQVADSISPGDQIDAVVFVGSRGNELREATVRNIKGESVVLALGPVK